MRRCSKLYCQIDYPQKSRLTLVGFEDAVDYANVHNELE